MADGSQLCDTIAQKEEAALAYQLVQPIEEDGRGHEREIREDAIVEAEAPLWKGIQRGEKNTLLNSRAYIR